MPVRAVLTTTGSKVWIMWKRVMCSRGPRECSLCLVQLRENFERYRTRSDLFAQPNIKVLTREASCAADTWQVRFWNAKEEALRFRDGFKPTFLEPSWSGRADWVSSSGRVWFHSSSCWSGRVGLYNASNIFTKSERKTGKISRYTISMNLGSCKTKTLVNKK